MDANATAALQNLASIAWIDVAFLIDADGRLLASFGSSPSFSPSGSFSVKSPEPFDDPKDSLYMTAVTAGIYLGVLFPASIPIEDVRKEVRQIEGTLAAAINQSQ